RLWIDGTSNLHGWSCKAETLDAAIELDKAAAAQLDAAPPKALKRVEVKVPIKSLKCGHDAMDNNLYKALDADKNAEVKYIMATDPNQWRIGRRFCSVGIHRGEEFGQPLES